MNVIIRITTEDGMIFKRPGSKYWQARFRVNGHLYERSTGQTKESNALEVLRLYRLQIERRGDPLRGPTCYADSR